MLIIIAHLGHSVFVINVMIWKKGNPVALAKCGNWLPQQHLLIVAPPRDPFPSKRKKKEISCCSHKTSSDHRVNGGVHYSQLSSNGGGGGERVREAKAKKMKTSPDTPRGFFWPTSKTIGIVPLITLAPCRLVPDLDQYS